jgi:hypothetical protein
MRSFKHTKGSLAPRNRVVAKKQPVYSSSLLMACLFVLMLLTGCDSNPPLTQEGGVTEQVGLESNGRLQTEKDSLQRIKELNEKLKKANLEIKNLKKQLEDERRGSGGTSFLLGLFFLVGGVGTAYFFRNSIRRAYQRHTGIEHPQKPAAPSQPVQKSAQEEGPVMRKKGAVAPEPRPITPAATPLEQSAPVDLAPKTIEPATPIVTAPLTLTAPATPPEKLKEAEIITDWEDVAPKQEQKPVTSAPPTIRFSYGAIDGSLQAFGEEDYDERTTFRIQVSPDGQTATYTVVNNERQQRNVIENQAAYAEAVEYRGDGEGHYANARIEPGILQLDGNRWRIVNRLIIDRA